MKTFLILALLIGVLLPSSAFANELFPLAEPVDTHQPHNDWCLKKQNNLNTAANLLCIHFPLLDIVDQINENLLNILNLQSDIDTLNATQIAHQAKYIGLLNYVAKDTVILANNTANISDLQQNDTQIYTVLKDHDIRISNLDQVDDSSLQSWYGVDCTTFKGKWLATCNNANDLNDRVTILEIEPIPFTINGTYNASMDIIEVTGTIDYRVADHYDYAILDGNGEGISANVESVDNFNYYFNLTNPKPASYSVTVNWNDQTLRDVVPIPSDIPHPPKNTSIASSGSIGYLRCTPPDYAGFSPIQHYVFQVTRIGDWSDSSDIIDNNCSYPDNGDYQYRSSAISPPMNLRSAAVNSYGQSGWDYWR